MLSYLYNPPKSFQQEVMSLTNAYFHYKKSNANFMVQSQLKKEVVSVCSLHSSLSSAVYLPCEVSPVTHSFTSLVGCCISIECTV